MPEPQTKPVTENLFPAILICQICGERQGLPQSPKLGPIVCKTCGGPCTLCFKNGEPMP